MSLVHFKIRHAGTSEWQPAQSFSITQGISDFVSETKGNPSDQQFNIETKVTTEDMVRTWTVFPSVRYTVQELQLRD